jgi:hypothetical protein
MPNGYKGHRLIILDDGFAHPFVILSETKDLIEILRCAQNDRPAGMAALYQLCAPLFVSAVKPLLDKTRFRPLKPDYLFNAWVAKW